MGALDTISEEFPKWWNDPQQQDFRDTLGMIFPTEPMDMALTAMGGPFGKAVKTGLGGLAALMYSPESEAGNATKAFNLVHRLLEKAGPAAQDLAAKIFQKAPLTFETIDPAELARSIQYSQRMAPMTPTEFLKRAAPMKNSLDDQYATGALRSLLDTGELGRYSPHDFNFDPDVQRRVFKGLSTTPHLSFVPEEQISSYLRGAGGLGYEARGMTPKVVGHEGRHSMSAIRSLYGNEPVAVEMRSPFKKNWTMQPGFDEQPLWSIEGMHKSGLVDAIPGFAAGGLVDADFASMFDKIPHNLPRHASSKSVMDRLLAPLLLPSDPGYEEPGLEPPMISPDDLIGTGIPSKLGALALGGFKGAGPLALGVIKQKGGNWLTGSVEGALKGLKSRVPVPEDATPRLPWTAEDDIEAARAVGLNKWIEGPLTKYVKRDMATPEDPIRALAEQGILHTELVSNPRSVAPLTMLRRSEAGFPREGLARTDLGNRWENIADVTASSATLRDHAPFGATVEEAFGPWAKGRDNETAFAWNRGKTPSDLGFDHLTDELRNALNPESGLPRDLLLNPADMQQMGIDRAVRHVDKINKWRAKEMERAALADMAGMPVVKDYPEQGFKWVELKEPTLPAGWEEDGGDIFGPGGTQLPARSSSDPRYVQLQKWLKQEGDSMGHCVGGYCDDVISGRSRIFSLRDAKGQPHVTIETTPHTEGFNNLLNQDVADRINAKQTAQIQQIKGKQNKPPKEEYLPFVQDFVKNHGPWSEVSDLENTGLYHFPADVPLRGPEQGVVVPAGYHSVEDIHKIFSEAGVPEKEIRSWMKAEGLLQ